MVVKGLWRLYNSYLYKLGKHFFTIINKGILIFIFPRLQQQFNTKLSCTVNQFDSPSLHQLTQFELLVSLTMKLKLPTAALAVILMTSLYYHPFPSHSNKTTAQNRNLLEGNDPIGQYDVLVKVFLNAQDGQLLLRNHLLKSGFEQTLKDFFNPDLDCFNGPDLPSYRGIDIDLKSQPTDVLPNKNSINKTSCILINSNLENTNNIQCYLIVKTKCSGKRKECSERVNGRFLDNLKSEKSKGNNTKKGNCDATISDLLANRKFSSAIFNFEVDDSSPEFSFDFKPSSESISEAKNVTAEGNDVRSKDVLCFDQCKAQHKALQDVYSDFGEDFFYYGDHECDHQGLNCNEDDLVTHIWISEYCQLMNFCLFYHN